MVTIFFQFQPHGIRQNPIAFPVIVHYAALFRFQRISRGVMNSIDCLHRQADQMQIQFNIEWEPLSIVFDDRFIHTVASNVKFKGGGAPVDNLIADGHRMMITDKFRYLIDKYVH